MTSQGKNDQKIYHHFWIYKMTIKYIPEGDKFKANQLWGEARHQLSILKNAMSFQNLQQLQKIVRFNDGTIIKCISCFGQDVVKVFVPQQVGEVKYKEDIYIRYYPAMEVYRKYGSRIVGIVLCKGGGFEPPYEFVPKEDLPWDVSDEKPEVLPGERTWFYPGAQYLNRRLDDIPPKGIAAVDLEREQTIPNKVTYSGGFIDVLTNTCQWLENKYYDFWCYRYCAKSGWHYAYTRTENYRVEYNFSSEILEPGHLLNFGEDLHQTAQGSGANDFHSQTLWSPVCQSSSTSSGCDESVNLDSVTALSEAQLAEAGDPPEITFTSRTDFLDLVGSYDYSYLVDTYKPWAWYSQFGSVMDENHYALVYSLKHDIYKKVWHKSVADQKKCIGAGCGEAEDCNLVADSIITTYEQTEGPLSVVVDGVVFELFPEAALEVSPRLQKYCSLKYFRIGEKSIGMFHIGKNYSEPYDWMYIYAQVTPEGNKVIVTEMPKCNTVIPGMTDLAGRALCTRGGLRLIRETITEEKEIVEG